MKKDWILRILFSLSSSVYAQSYDGDENYSSYQYVDFQKDTTLSDPKSTPAKDAQDASKKAHQETDKKETKLDKKEFDKKEKDSNKKDEDKKESDKKEADKKEDKPKSPHTFTGTVSFVSDYRFRGISQTMRRPAVQGNLDYSHVNGFYLGTFGSNVDGTTNFYNNTSMEWDFYGGIKGKMCPCGLSDLAYNVGIIYYYYPGGQTFRPDHVRYDTLEFYIELTYKWLSIKYSQSLSDYFGANSDNPPFNWDKRRFSRPNGNSVGSNYIEANALFELRKKVCYRWLQGGKLSLLLHVGHATVRHDEQESYTDWRATLTQEFPWLNVFVTYVGTNAKHAYFDVPDHAFHPKKHALGAQGFVVGVIRSF